ncbi:MAG TPA: thermosome subunit [Nanoarchaeota archaeon]|nr:thermosome subunit [Nanoarchaeota archaeon]HIH66351.1 thermosome subunit [Nanoarchaeota archaeon]
MAQGQPVFILPENISRMIGRDAQRNNIMAARLVAETVKSTLGPRGMDKMLVDSIGDITVTNDGVTILEEMQIEHPAAKMMVEIAKTQEAEVGDGTTTAVVIAGELLKNAEKLLDQDIHPTVVARGYRLASEQAIKVLHEISTKIDRKDRALLVKIAATAITGKGAESARDMLAELIVDSVLQVSEGNEVDLDSIKIEKKKGKSISQSELIKGIVLDKERVHPDMPKRVENAKIALLDCALEIKGPETDTKVSISSPDQLQAFLDQEEKMLKGMVEKVKKSGANVVFCQKGIDDVAQYYFARAGILAARRIKKSDMEKLAKATTGRIASNLNELSDKDLGSARLVEEVKEGKEEEGMLYVRDCPNPKAITLLVRGGTEHVVDEVERAIKDGLGDVAVALRDGKVVAGGGSIEVAVARRLREYSQTLKGREQLAVEEFALSLESIPKILAENSGLDPIDILTELKAQHDAGNMHAGIVVGSKGEVKNAFEAGVIEPLRIKTQAITSASEVATMILRIDDVVAAGKSSSGAMPHGMGGMPDME